MQLIAADLRASGLSDVNSIYGLLHTLLNHAIDRGWLARSPLQGLSKRERPRQKSVNPRRRLGDPPQTL
jgi:hypothetical protein